MSIFILAALAASAAQLPPVTLWSGAAQGMSPAEVRRVLPSASRPAKPLVLSGGEVEALTMPAAEGPTPMRAHLFFSAGRLASVQLRPAAEGSADPAATFAAWSALLSRRYGRGYDCGDHSFADVALYECKWLSGGVSVRYWYSDVAGEAPLQYVSFRSAAEPGSDA